MSPDRRPGPPLEEPRASLSLLDYRRRVADLYTAVRGLPPPEAHDRWRRGRDALFASHPQSPIRADRRTAFDGLPVWDYDERFRFEVPLLPADGETAVALPHSGGDTTPGRAIGIVELSLPTGTARLTVFRLVQYGDGLFLPFADGTAGVETYAGGRYLLDTAKGADLGSRDHELVVDFNFAFHPSCVHDPTWSCPLPPASNRFEHRVQVGEHLGGD